MSEIQIEEARGVAEGPLAVVKEFVNTLDIEDGKDELSTPAELKDFFARNNLGRTAPTADDVRATHEVREALRAMLLANNGEPLDPRATQRLNEAAHKAQLVVSFQPGGASDLRPQGTGVDAAIGRILSIVHTSMATGTWPRLKACRDHTCEFAFFDQSKNHSRTWCNMDVCGNRTKARTYRRRHKVGP